MLTSMLRWDTLDVTMEHVENFLAVSVRDGVCGVYLLLREGKVVYAMCIRHGWLAVRGESRAVFQWHARDRAGKPVTISAWVTMRRHSPDGIRSFWRI